MNKQQPNPQRIRRVTESIINLPTLPTVVSKMLDLIDNPKTSAASLARLISTDQTLTARILKLANSAYYGFPREITTVNMAIVVLGFNTVREMGLSLSVFEVLKNSEDGELFDLSRFWEHSIGCGVAARTVAHKYRPELAGEAFVAGLLHDIGKVIFNQYFKDDFLEIMRLVHNGAMSLDEAEREIMGTTHAEVGGWLAEKWNLPKLIVDSITYHHTPFDARSSVQFVSLICIANYLVHLCSIGDSGRNNPLVPDNSVWEQIDGSVVDDEEALDSLQTDFLIDFDKAETFMSFIQE
jgi:putative nucleotidyltransferase with HDIG domain